ncbi:MAG: SH3 domain-containing protein [Planctomycetota bacterium]|nr:MAG: SH3 domain-containing protein [Planctomycetota bacterium]
MFSLVSADYIETQGGRVGTVKVASGTLRVRVGSLVVESDPRIREVQTRLEAGTQVRILGRQDGWYRIEPPPGVFFYVSADFSERISEREARELMRKQPASLATTERTPHATLAADATPQPPANEEETTMSPPAEPMRIVEPRPAEQAGMVDGSGGSAPLAAASRSEPATPPAAAPAQGSRSLRERLSAMEPAMIRALRSPPNAASDQEWVDRLRPLVNQRQDASVADRASFWMIRFQSRINRGRASSPTTPAAATTGESVEARGVLYPSFEVPAGPYGLRYRLVTPHTNRVTAYVEFDPLLGLNPSRLVGKYVGVTGEPYLEPTKRVQVIRARSTTTLATPDGGGREGGG